MATAASPLQTGRTVLMALLLLLCTLAAALPGVAQETRSDPAVSVDDSRSTVTSADASSLMKTERFRRLAGELRCLVCQNQSLVDSNAPLAQDLRTEVLRLMSSGRDDQQIKTYLVDRYGEFVLYRPALSLRNALLWIGPFVLLFAGLVAWWRLGRRRAAGSPSAQETLKHVDELLGQ